MREEARCNAILTNVRRARFHEGNIENALATAVALNPYCIEAYSVWRQQGSTFHTGLTELMNYLDIREADLEPTELQAPTIHSANTCELQAGFIKILDDINSADFYVAEQIPPKKLRGAIEKYFNVAFFASLYDSGFAHGQALGRPLALIDATMLGSAEEGLVICDLGVVWKTGPNSGAYTWTELAKRSLPAETGMLSIRIGEKRMNNSSQVKNAALAALVNNLVGLYRSSHLAI